MIRGLLAIFAVAAILVVGWVDANPVGRAADELRLGDRDVIYIGIICNLIIRKLQCEINRKQNYLNAYSIYYTEFQYCLVSGDCVGKNSIDDGYCAGKNAYLCRRNDFSRCKWTGKTQKLQTYACYNYLTL